jgi:MOSC domain-containing protein YiiM
VTEPVQVGRLGLTGDTICDTANHGGPDQAVYAYAEEDAAWWQAELADELSFPLRPGSFGENLTLRGIEVSDAVIGERWRIGGVILQVATPRIPCSTFAGFWQVRQLVKRFTQAGRPGAYLRVLTEGELRAGDPITVLDRRPQPGPAAAGRPGAAGRGARAGPDLAGRQLQSKLASIWFDGRATLSS